VAKSKKTTLKLIQISDCHLSAERGADYRGQNADRNLDSVLQVARAWDPDLVLVTGDISEDASAASYARVAVMLGTFGSPLLVLPGNHDDPSVMRRHFHNGPWGGPFVKEMGDWLLVLLDSSAPGKISGVLSQQMLEKLDQQLRGSDAKFILIALHHQPVPVGAPWIDKYALEEPQRLFHHIDRDRRVRCISWGHVHHDFQQTRNGATLLGAPSAVANSLPRTERFTLDLEGPSCRWLELGSDGKVETGLLRPSQSSTGRTSHRIR
jgi:Icc protein